MPFLYALALMAITPDQSADIRCVAQLGIVADEQRHHEGWNDYPDMNVDGAEYAAIVGDDVVETTGQTPEQVRDLIFAQVMEVRGKLDRGDIDRCAARMLARVPLPAPTSAAKP